MIQQRTPGTRSSSYPKRALAIGLKLRSSGPGTRKSLQVEAHSHHPREMGPFDVAVGSRQAQPMIRTRLLCWDDSGLCTRWFAQDPARVPSLSDLWPVEVQQTEHLPSATFGGRDVKSC